MNQAILDVLLVNLQLEIVALLNWLAILEQNNFRSGIGGEGNWLGNLVALVDLDVLQSRSGG